MITINWRPSKNDIRPLYRQIFLYMKTKILSGEWPEGSKLPPQRQLAADFQINRSTIRIAFDELIAEGLVTSKVGSGMRVANAAWSQYAQNKPLDWQNYISAGSFLENLPLIQEINRLEFKPDIIRLGTGELAPELLPINQLNGLLKSSAPKAHYGYEEPKGLLYLRQELCRQLAKIGINTSPESILIVSGALQALQLIFFGLLPADSNIYLERPSYLSSLKLMQSIHAKLFEIPLDENGLNIHSLRYQYKDNAHNLLYTIPTFHNPTGTVMSPDRRHQLMQVCNQLRLPILEDDVYRDLWLNTPPPPPLKSLDTTGNVIYVDSLSKAIGPGLRIGWIVGPERVIDKLADIKMQNDYGSSCLSQWVAAEWFAAGLHEKHLKKLRAELSMRQALVVHELNHHFSDIAVWAVPQGGFYIWLTLHRPLSLTKLFKAALGKNILLNPGNLYDNITNTNIRISFAYATVSQLQSAIKTLAELIKREYT